MDLVSSRFHILLLPRRRTTRARLDGLHGREQEHLLDVYNVLLETKAAANHKNLTGRVGEEHDQSIDAHSPASGGRETVF